MKKSLNCLNSNLRRNIQLFKGLYIKGSRFPAYWSPTFNYLSHFYPVSVSLPVFGISGFIYLFSIYLRVPVIVSQYANSCLPIRLRSLSAIVRKNIRLFFGEFRFFILHTEVLTFKPEFPEKFTGFTEAPFFFPLTRVFASGAEHSCTSGIGRTALTGAGFKVMV